MSNNVLSTIFNISKDAVRRAIYSAKTALARDFVPLNVGFPLITRQNVNRHTRPIAQTLFGTEGRLPAIIVIDDTYYIQ